MKIIIVLMCLCFIACTETTQTSAECSNAKMGLQAAQLAQVFLCSAATPVVASAESREFNIDQCKAAQVAVAATLIIVERFCGVAK